MGGAPRRFARGFPLLYLLSLIALVIAGNAAVGGWGLEYVIFAFLLGLAVSNIVGVPSWLAEAAYSGCRGHQEREGHRSNRRAACRHDKDANNQNYCEDELKSLKREYLRGLKRRHDEQHDSKQDRGGCQ